MKNRHYFSSIFFIFLYSFLHATYNDKIQGAIDDLYNFKFQESIKTLEELSLEYPEDPLTPFLKISVYWQESLLYQNPESSYKLIDEGIDYVVPFYEDMIQTYPHEQNYKLFLGSLYGLKARVALAKSDWMGLAIYGSKGFTYINSAKKKDPYLYDVYMPIGTIEYFLCKSSSPLQMIGQIFGLKSDCHEAIKKLELASSHGEYSWIEAKNVLSYIYLYIEKDYNKALEITSHLVDYFPGHPFFAYLKAETLIFLKEYNKVDQMDTTLQLFYNTGPKNQRLECYNKYLYLGALRAYQEKNFDYSIHLTTEIIHDYDLEFNWVLGYAHFIRGKSLEMVGRRSDAIHDYKNAVKYLENYPEQKEAELLIFNPISEG